MLMTSRDPRFCIASRHCTDIHHHGEGAGDLTLLRTNLSSASTYIVITSILGNLVLSAVDKKRPYFAIGFVSLICLVFCGS
jgi:hypothetical protein